MDADFRRQREHYEEAGGSMTTEGMPEHVKAWLIERLEGMKVVEDDMNQWRTGHNKAIDAVIALVREG